MPFTIFRVPDLNLFFTLQDLVFQFQSVPELGFVHLSANRFGIQCLCKKSSFEIKYGRDFSLLGMRFGIQVCTFGFDLDQHQNLTSFLNLAHQMA